MLPLCSHRELLPQGARGAIHLIYFKGRFNRPVEPGDLKNKWE